MTFEATSSGGIINFLGSSYSGADIKLAVHTSLPVVTERYRIELAEKFSAEERRLNEEWMHIAEYNEPLRSQEESRIMRERELNQMKKDDLERHKNQEFPAFLPLASAQSLSVQVFREKRLVRALGHVAPKGVVRGARTTAGTIIFTTFDEHALASLLHRPPTMFSHEDGLGIRALIDQLPPMTITAIFANEYGSLSEMNIYGVEFIDDGQVLSIEDFFTENTCTFIARGYDVLLKRGRVDLVKSVVGASVGNSMAPQSGSSLLGSSEYTSFKDRLGLSRDPYK